MRYFLQIKFVIRYRKNFIQEDIKQVRLRQYDTISKVLVRGLIVL